MDHLRNYVTKNPNRKPAEWAEQFGISRPHFYDLIDGRRNPSLAVAVRIQRATGGEVPVAAWPNHAAVMEAVAAGQRGAVA